MNPVIFVNLPERSEEFKVVQIYFKEQPYLLCGDKSLKDSDRYYHKSILKTFLTDRDCRAGVDYDLVAPNPLNDSYKIPAIKKDGLYEVVGAGFAAIDSDIFKMILPYGSSIDYSKLGIKGINSNFNVLIKKTLESQNSYWFKSLDELPAEIVDAYHKKNSINSPF